ncbi:hypothetical protein ACN08P_18280 [Photobacterium leiognathi subsp. mandapamensis]|uniref:hypothetical protein n=1 Tax=Photobacterium leiognathi TaxID=553611 RepID=UPI003AF33FAA
MNKKEKEPTPDNNLFKDFRYIVKTCEWNEKEVDFPVEILCSVGDEINIKNCEIKKGLIIRLDDGVQIGNIHIYNSNISEHLKIFAHDGGNIVGEVSIDTCEIDVLEINQLSASLDVYKSNIGKLHTDSNNFSKFKIDHSNVTKFICYHTRADEVEISNGTFKLGGIVPTKLFSDFNKRYNNKEYAQDATVQTLDFLLKNRSTSLCTYEYSELLYFRNKAQTRSMFHHCLLWLFGYFNDLSRYVTTAIIFLSSVFFSLMMVSIKSNLSLPVVALIRLSIDSFIGFSNTYGYNEENHLVSVVLSCSIGLGTIFYSGLLVTLINRFRIRF